MAQSIKEVLQEINAMPHKVHFTKEYREPGAVWPAHQPDDLEPTYWTDNVMELV